MSMFDHVPGTLRKAPYYPFGCSVEVCYHVSQVDHLESRMWEPGRVCLVENGLFGAIFTVEIIRGAGIVDQVRLSCWSKDIRPSVRLLVAPGSRRDDA